VTTDERRSWTAAPSPVVDREALAQYLFDIRTDLRSAGDPDHWLGLADLLISAGWVRTPAAQPDRSSLQVLIARAINGGIRERGEAS
jgi:hypothetical protein